jgi:putative acetyltransferase
MIRIRQAGKLDRESIREVHLRAFSENENQAVSTLAVNLLNEDTNLVTFALLAEADGMIAGHIAFSPVTADDNEKWRGYILAPLGVKPEFQKRQIGAKLVESGLDRLRTKGVSILFVYGDPKYYGRFGFETDAASGYSPPYELQYPFGWQAIKLNEAGLSESAVSLSCVASLRDRELW